MGIELPFERNIATSIHVNGRNTESLGRKPYVRSRRVYHIVSLSYLVKRILVI
jgi:hypothetical protein